MWYMYQTVHRVSWQECELVGKLQVEAERVAAATSEDVWALISDATTYPRWGPWSEAAYRSPGDASPRGPGAVYWLRSSHRYGLTHPVSVEKILDAEEGRSLAYTVVGGIPVRNYRAEITLTPAAGGTRILWTASWDQTLLGRLVHRSLRRLYPQIVASLAAAAERAPADRLR
jgi:uncharacterized protein YndB with AHSA1/START domain